MDPIHGKGCLDVKCPLSCQMISVEEACRKVTAFCLLERDGVISLSKVHSYFYLIQTQMHVTKCRWCDFVVWSPIGSPFIQRIEYDAAFMKGAIIKAQKFYFEQFLPAVVAHIIMPSSVVSSNSVLTNKKSTSVQPKSTRQFFNDRASNNASVTKPSSTAVHLETVQKCTSQLQTDNTVSSDVQILTVKQSKLMPLDAVLRTLHIVKHAVKGDGSCLYHAISQAGLISNKSHGDEKISMHLRKIALEVTNKHPTVRLEGNYSKLNGSKNSKKL